MYGEPKACFMRRLKEKKEKNPQNTTFYEVYGNH